MAITHAIVILSWYEHLPEEEMPPRWMWPLSDELENHFEQVKANRKSGTSSSDDDDADTGSMMRNDLARGRGRNAR